VANQQGGIVAGHGCGRGALRTETERQYLVQGRRFSFFEFQAIRTLKASLVGVMSFMRMGLVALGHVLILTLRNDAKTERRGLAYGRHEALSRSAAISGLQMYDTVLRESNILPAAFCPFLQLIQLS